jgi:hypothetical protein
MKKIAINIEIKKIEMLKIKLKSASALITQILSKKRQIENSESKKNAM